MTTMSTPLLAEQEADLVHQLIQVQEQHPLGASFRLVIGAPAPQTVADEVLVQTVNAEGVIELRPRKITDLAPDDLLHTTQVLDPADTDFTDYGLAPRADWCRGIQRPDGTTGHLYAS
ncbi:hypothetical protein ACFU99_42955 [Streptomyces sp. NPDC057654]|uniref:hypothetical protein n=1 Tax=Streptomyces sp. NPDC057654 TaxID=3346196 RepID=UPI0036C16A6B